MSGSRDISSRSRVTTICEKGLIFWIAAGEDWAREGAMPRPIVMPLYTTPPDPPTSRSTAGMIAAQRLARARSRNDHKLHDRSCEAAASATTSAMEHATFVSERQPDTKASATEHATVVSEPQSDTKVSATEHATDVSERQPDTKVAADAAAMAEASVAAEDGQVKVTEVVPVDGVVADVSAAADEAVVADGEVSAVADEAVRAAQAAELVTLEMAFEKATAEVRQTEAAMKDGDPPTTWIEYGGAQLEPLLSFTTLLDVRWLLAFARREVLPELGGVVPAWQALPAVAEVKLDDLRRSSWYNGLPIGALSYGWASDAQ